MEMSRLFALELGSNEVVQHASSLYATETERTIQTGREEGHCFAAEIGGLVRAGRYLTGYRLRYGQGGTAACSDKRDRHQFCEM